MEAIEISEENVPPSKKLKQAKLSFFKALAPATKLSSPSVSSQGIKRKLSNDSESPNKVAKLSKPLIPSINNTECSPNSKVQHGKSTKIDIEDHDQEVSSSSEADVTAGKNNGKCCLMERFVRKLPKDVVHQEISSTNEVLDISAELELAESDKDESECIVIEEEDCNEVSEVIEKSNKKNDVCSGEIVQESQRAKSLTKNDLVGEESPSVGEAEKEALEKPDIFTPSKSKSIDSKLSVVTPETSTPIRKDKIGSPKGMSTPLSAAVSSLDTSNSSGETPTTDAKKKVRKVSTAKKAEIEMMRQKKKEEKEKEKAEKKRKLEEEKMKKEQLRQEQKEAKEREKQQQKEKLEKERLEKLKAKEEEKKKKEEERLQKEEEKKKLIEAKQEEKRKKEEEKRVKDEEKRIQDEEKKLKEEERIKEEERKKKKAEKTKQAFQSFFIKPKEPEQKPVVAKSSASIFFPFQLKKDMHLAPAVRSNLTDDKKDNLDQFLQADKVASSNYLEELKTKEVQPCKTGRVPRKNPQADEEVEIVHDTEALKKAFHQVKLLQFHTDVRPPYYGTWRKTTSLNPRNPWYKDGATFDYEVDSEEEWEEEEPGESLSCSEGEEGEEKGEEAADDDEEEDGWMVPHGYLSEDEGCNDDDEITPEKLKLQQQAKAKAWEMEQKRKLQAAPVIAVGCFFEHSPSQAMVGDVRLLYEFRGVIIAPVVPIPTSQSMGLAIEENGTEQEGTTPKVKGPKKYQKKEVPDDAMPHLIQLTHGSTCGLKRLVREFRVFWLKKHDQPSSNGSDSLNDSGDTSMLNDSVSETVVSNEDKDSTEKCGDKDEIKCEEGYGCSISKRQLEMKITSIGVREKRPGFNKVCWYVHPDVLSQWKLESLSLPNTWVFSSSGPSKSPNPNLNKSLNSSKVTSTDLVEPEKEIVDSKPTDQRSIMSFTMSREEIMKQESLKPKPDPVVEPMEVVEEKSKTKPVNDQRSIMSFTKTKNELNLLASKSVNLDEKQQFLQQSEQKLNMDSSTAAKTPVTDKKPKVSVMDLLLKKSSACKKKLPVEPACAEKMKDSDAAIKEEIPSKRSKNLVNDTVIILNPDPIKGEVVAMEVDTTSDAGTKDVPAEVKAVLPEVKAVFPEVKVTPCPVKVVPVDQKKEINKSDNDVICIDNDVEVICID